MRCSQTGSLRRRPMHRSSFASHCQSRCNWLPRASQWSRWSLKSRVWKKRERDGKGLERVQAKLELLSKLLLACTIQFSWPLLTDSPQFFFTRHFCRSLCSQQVHFSQLPWNFANSCQIFIFRLCQVSHTTADDLKLLATNKTLQALQTRKRTYF